MLALALILVAIVDFVRVRCRQATHRDAFTMYASAPQAVPRPIAASGASITPLPGPAPNTVYVFWTGGFDSTFRVLQAVLSSPKAWSMYELNALVPDALLELGPRPKWGLLFKKVDHRVFQAVHAGKSVVRMRVRSHVPHSDVVDMLAPACMMAKSVLMTRVHLS